MTTSDDENHGVTNWLLGSPEVEVALVGEMNERGTTSGSPKRAPTVNNGGGEHSDVEDVLLDLLETAAFLRVSPETVKYLRSQRRFATAIKIGRRVLWLRSDLLARRNQQRESA
jgi:hypothetical protein